MSASPWAPPQTGSQPSTPVLPPPQAMPTRPQTGPPPAGPPLPVAPPPRPPRRGFPWLLVGGAVVLLIAAIAATAAITYAVTRNTNAPSATPPPAPTVQAPQFSAAEQNAAKDQVCHVFDVSTRGTISEGSVRTNGQPNVPVVLRAMNSAVAVQNALKPAAPPAFGRSTTVRRRVPRVDHRRNRQHHAWRRTRSVEPSHKRRDICAR